MVKKVQGDIRIVHGEIEELPDSVHVLENKSKEFRTIYLSFKKLLASQNTNSLFNTFAELVEVPIAVIDLEANVLASSRWQKICTDFHRTNSESCHKCLESDIELANQLDAGKDYTMYSCKNGMVDCASPIIIEGYHVANIFVGQFLTEEADRDFFRNNAQRYGFNEKAYMEALDEVTIVEQERSEKILRFLTEFTKFISLMALDKIHAMQVEKKYQDELTQKIKEEVEKNRKKDQQLIQQSRLAQMGEMISMIAHQWRQPLGIISAASINLQLKLELEDHDLKKEKGRQSFLNYFNKTLRDIDSCVQNLTTTIDDFRNFYKPDKKTVSIKLEEVISKSLNIIMLSLTNDNIEIIEEYNSKEEIELYDKEMMQVILNILKNSQDNLKEKGIKDPYIKIATNNRTVIICDNGRGIPKDIIDKIFDPYFSTKDEKNGTGLGLYMSKTIVEDHHNGKLTATNTDDGVCFTIELGIIPEKYKL